MSKPDFEVRFETAHARLNNALKNLEKTTIDKLHETAAQSRMLNMISDDNSLNAKVSEQLAIIHNLTDEVNKLQESLANLGNENEVLIEENKNLSDKLTKLKIDGGKLTEKIEIDLEHISAIIAGEKND